MARALAKLDDAELCLSVVALGEFSEGFEDQNHPIVDAVRKRHRILDTDEETARIYGRLARELRASGALIGANDLWIGCSAVRHAVPILTADSDHFSQIPGLDVIDHRVA
ncbi:MAG: type II toxin-antitoxin system VapC family toxin [Acidimicrobiia bacterium]